MARNDVCTPSPLCRVFLLCSFAATACGSARAAGSMSESSPTVSQPRVQGNLDGGPQAPRASTLGARLPQTVSALSRERRWPWRGEYCPVVPETTAIPATVHMISGLDRLRDNVPRAKLSGVEQLCVDRMDYDKPLIGAAFRDLRRVLDESRGSSRCCVHRGSNICQVCSVRAPLPDVNSGYRARALYP
jgi:hypothetical protein